MSLRHPILAALLLAGCAASQNDKMKAALDPYVGRPVADHVVAKGPPASVTDLGPNKKLFRWAWTRQGPGALVPVGGAIVAVPSQQQQCVVSFVATTSKPNPTLQDWIIENWNWEGAC